MDHLKTPAAQAPGFAQFLARALQPLPAAQLDDEDDGADLALMAQPISRAPNAGAAVLA